MWFKKHFLCFSAFSAFLYMNLLSILKLDNVFRLKIAVITYKLLIKNNNVPMTFINTISTASSQHSYTTRFAENQNFIRSKTRTKDGVFTFRFVSSKILESIPYHIKQSDSISIFKKQYSQFLLFLQT